MDGITGFANKLNLGNTLVVSGIVGISVGLSMIVYGRCDDKIVFHKTRREMGTSVGTTDYFIPKKLAVGSIVGLGLVSAYAVHRYLQK